MPYAEDLRDLNEIKKAAGYEAEEVAEETPIIDKLKKDEKDAAKLLIKNLTIDFNSRNFENPTI